MGDRIFPGQKATGQGRGNLIQIGTVISSMGLHHCMDTLGCCMVVWHHFWMHSDDVTLLGTPSPEQYGTWLPMAMQLKGNSDCDPLPIS